MTRTERWLKEIASAATELSCSCSKCVMLCEKNPGWMTPNEAERAIEAGFAARLMRDWLEPNSNVGNDERIYILAPASEGCEGDDAPEMDFMSIFESFGWCKGRCTFLKNGKCKIHDSGFKPIQCRLSLACDLKKGEACPDNYAVALLWNNEAAQNLVEQWQRQISAQSERVCVSESAKAENRSRINSGN